MAFDQSTRNRLQNFVADSRNILTEEFTRQLQSQYGLDPKTGNISELESLSFLDNQGRETAIVLRDTLSHYLVTIQGKSEKERIKQAINRIIREQAFTVLNRLCALRMAEARGFLIESVSEGYSSKGFKLYKQIAGTALGDTGEAYKQYLFSIFDEFSTDLAVLFDRHSAQGRLFPKESALQALLEEINHFDLEKLWAEDETIGWIYQYFNSQEERKKMRAESSAPRNSRELAVRNQFFTPRYVVEFLTDNTLGRIWYEMTKGETELVDHCQYLVQRPNEVFLKEGESAPEGSDEDEQDLSQEELLQQTVFIPYRALKDPREILMLDPACGSMHFGLYAFDLYEKIYEEAWQMESEIGLEALKRSKELKPLQSTYESIETFKKDIPKLIIEHNIHGVDIDFRAVQIAGLSLWLRAQRNWHEAGIKPNLRPSISRSNIVCAEPMPGEKELLKEFTSQINPPILGQLVETIFEKMELAGEAGTLLKIEEEIASAIEEAREAYNEEILKKKRDGDYLPGLAPDKNNDLFDFTDLPDDINSFWDTAEEQILLALQAYADKSESGNGQRRLFAEDAARGFSFIDLSRKHFDFVLMNPPFGEPSKKSKKQLKSYYNDLPADIYCWFYQRGENLLKENGLIGAITSSSFKTYRDYEGFRTKFIISGKLNLFFDLGWNVLDNAYVETCCYICSRQTTLQEAEFIDARDEEVKISALKNKKAIFLRDPTKFALLEGAPIIPNWNEERYLYFSKMGNLDSYCDLIGKGAGPHNIFYRLHWEVPASEKGFDNTWVEFTNGGSYSPFWRESNLVLHWHNGGELVKGYLDKKYPYLNGNYSWNIQNEETYGREGITWGKKTTNFSAQYMQKGTIYSFEGLAAFPKNDEDLHWILAYLNSRFVAWYLNSTCGLHKNPTYVASLPVPNFTNFDKNKLSSITKKAIRSQMEFYSEKITSPRFVIGSRNNIESIQNDIDSALKEIDSIVNEEIGLSNDDLHDDELKRSFNKSIDTKSLYNELDISLGVIFKRWEVKDEKIDQVSTLTPRNQSISSQIKDKIKGKVDERDIYSIDLDSNMTLINDIKKVAEIIGEDLDFEYIKSENRHDLLSFITDKNQFFDKHLDIYNSNRIKAPIYWLLQTPSGSFSILTCYQNVNEQTLYRCVNDFVEPKLKSITNDLNTLKDIHNRSSAEENELSKLTDLEAEIKDFRDELLRIAKFWKPNLNDGVEFTAAPLWKLFQHNKWQKKLKKTWEKLKVGEYDWTHLAFNIWPERVLRKCHEDRSIALAHNFLDLFWEEKEVPVYRGKKKTEKTKLEWVQKDYSDSELEEVIQGIIKEKLQ